MNVRVLLIAASVSLLVACSSDIDGDSGSDVFPVDIADQFSVAIAPYDSVKPEDVISGSEQLEFRRLFPPDEIFAVGSENWMKVVLALDKEYMGAAVLEIPGHLFSRVDIWFKFSDGTISHDYSGRRYPYAERKIKHAGIAFAIPFGHEQPMEVYIRNRSGVPINFSAVLWSAEKWDSYVSIQRLWYGIFLGGIAILVIYNLFFAALLKEKSYLYYVGYVLSLCSVVLIYSGLPEEFIWREGLRRNYILLVSSFGIFFGVGFVNSFLNVRQRYAFTYRASVAFSSLAVIFGLLLAFRIHIVPSSWTGTLMHLFLLLGAFYFIGMSLLSYFAGMKQARFLALSMVVFVAGLIAYFLYTYGVVRYNPYLIHAVEIGSLLEGIILSLALADRINLLSQAKEEAEKQALHSQRYFSKRLLTVQELDREKFSNAMHDSIGHGLLVLKQNLERIAQSGEGGPSKPNSVKLLEQAAFCGELLGDVRGISHDLHPHLLNRLGLKAAIESTLERAFKDGDIDWNADIELSSHAIDKESEITIYRVLQECINNILKHSDASEVIVSLRNEDDYLMVSIKDDGSGVPSGPPESNGLGLRAMEERIELFGGWFKLVSVNGVGTHIRFGLPVNK
ncbi:MAG: hypothetical protein DRR15_08315 [Gammaproteobacteria bacterium]|nr:MAG: hypothetical protein DRR15_08315 [Gammaproteobacteria bacterium]